jgi:membrane dipeptidase
MSYYTEQDPLLPNSKQSPEIQGSRPQSINNDNDNDNDNYNGTGNGNSQGNRNQPNTYDYASDKDMPTQRSVFVTMAFNILLGLIIVAALAITLFPDEILGGGGLLRPKPRTLDGRVTRILETTPLIGIPPSLVHTISATNSS